MSMLLRDLFAAFQSPDLQQLIFNTYVGSVASLGSVLIFYVYDAAAGAGC